MEEVALRYGEALYSLAVETNKISQIQNEIKLIKEVIADNKEFIKLISSPFLSIAERSEKIEEIFKSFDQQIISFLCVIIRNNRADLLFDIFDAFNSCCNEHFNVKEGLLISSHGLNKDIINKIENKIATLEGCKVSLKLKIDPQLIGGFKVVINEHQYDTSIKKQIEQLRGNLLLGGKAK